MTGDAPTRLRAIIVDDEPLSRRAMRQLLDARDDVEVIAEHASAAELAATAGGADVVFLDVEMPGRSGIDVARAMAGPGGPLVVFVTAYDEYAVPAFDANAVDYLTKPVAPVRLARAIARVQERLRAVAALAEPASPPAVLSPPSLVARLGAREVVIPVAEVTLLEADGVYAAVHVGGRRHLVRRSLDDLERALGPAGFVRVHRSYLVRRSAIVEVRPTATRIQRELVLTSGAVVPVSRRRQAAVARRIHGDPE